MRLFRTAALLTASLLCSSIVLAEAPILGTMQAFIVEIENDKETLKEAEKVEPKQLVEYQMTYVNKGDSSINGLTVVGPVPEGTEYVSDTADADVSSQLLVSIDGGKTFESEPVIRLETKASGEVVEKLIPPTEYTHLQWKAKNPINAEGGKQIYSYRVRVK